MSIADFAKAGITLAKEVREVGMETAFRKRLRTVRDIPHFFPKRAGSKDFRIGGCLLREHAETTHTIAFGAPGTGKSVAIKEYLDQIVDYGYPAIIYDKKGEMVQDIFDPSKGHILFSPFDARSPAWLLWDELTYVAADMKLVGSSRREIGFSLVA